MTYLQMKSVLAEDIYLIMDAMMNSTKDICWGRMDLIPQLVKAFLSLAPDDYFAALQADSTAKGKTASEIEAGLNKRND